MGIETRSYEGLSHAAFEIHSSPASQRGSMLRHAPDRLPSLTQVRARPPDDPHIALGPQRGCSDVQGVRNRHRPRSHHSPAAHSASVSQFAPCGITSAQRDSPALSSQLVPATHCPAPVQAPPRATSGRQNPREHTPRRQLPSSRHGPASSPGAAATPSTRRHTNGSQPRVVPTQESPESQGDVPARQAPSSVPSGATQTAGRLLIADLSQVSPTAQGAWTTSHSWCAGRPPPQ